ncbi:polysaccharide biosynthesis C-terminal domain-containing protein [Porticoccaceae bacterium]|nr:polysaccharide biosynthesis C-terminal domain-containing protein [Porticoccaceae bacterium]
MYNSHLVLPLLSRIVNLISSLFVGLVLAAYFGPHHYGFITVVLTLLSFFRPITLLGLSNTLPIMSINHSESTYFYSSIVCYMGISAVISALLIFLVNYQFNGLLGYYGEMLIYFIPVYFLFSLQYLFRHFYETKFLFSKLYAIDIFGVVFSSLVKLCFVYFKVDFHLFLLVIVFENLLFAFMYVYFYGFPKFRHTNFIVSKILKSSFPFILSSLSIILYMKVDILMIDFYMTKESVGLYGFSSRLVESILVFPALAVSVVYPYLVKSFKSLSSTDRISIYVVGFSACIVTIAIVFILLVNIVSFLFPEFEFINTYIWLSLLSIPFATVSMISYKYHIINGKAWMMTPSFVIACLFNILLNSIMIPKYGLIGAAASTVMSQFFIAFIYDLFFDDLKTIGFEKILMLTRLFHPSIYSARNVKQLYWKIFKQ